MQLKHNLFLNLTQNMPSSYYRTAKASGVSSSKRSPRHDIEQRLSSLDSAGNLSEINIPLSPNMQKRKPFNI